tara:strand:- start:24362 stop:25423 length:1062 start_codon:yes stop_codon:yes gene_type:complete
MKSKKNFSLFCLLFISIEAVANEEVNSKISFYTGLETVKSTLFPECGQLINLTRPKLIEIKKRHKYPKRALLSGIQAQILFKYTVTKTGEIENEEIIWSDSENGKYLENFEKAALKSLKTWIYEPAKGEFGNPVDLEIIKAVGFTIEGYEGYLNLLNMDKEYRSIAKNIKEENKILYINQINLILSREGLSSFQRAAFLYMRALYELGNNSSNQQIISTLEESQFSYFKPNFYSLNGEEQMYPIMGYNNQRLHSFAGVLAGELYAKESMWEESYINLSTALYYFYIENNGYIPKRFIKALSYLGIAAFNKGDLCVSYYSLDTAEKVSSYHKVGFPDSLVKAKEEAYKKYRELN